MGRGRGPLLAAAVLLCHAESHARRHENLYLMELEGSGKEGPSRWIVAVDDTRRETHGNPISTIYCWAPKNTEVL